MSDDRHAQANDQQSATIDLRDSWREFARRQGGSFREGERRGLERILPAAVWRPTIRFPIRDWTLVIEAVRRSLLGSWRKQRPSVRDWIAPGGSPSFDYTTTLSLRFRPAAPFRLAVGPASPTGGSGSLERMRHNVEFGPPIDVRRGELHDPESILVHASDATLAGNILSDPTRDELRRLAESDAPFELLVHDAPRAWGLGASEMEVRLRIGALLVDHEDLEGFAAIVRESFEQMHRAGLVQARGRGLLS